MSNARNMFEIKYVLVRCKENPKYNLKFMTGCTRARTRSYMKIKEAR